MEFDQKERPINILKGLGVVTLEHEAVQKVIHNYERSVPIPVSQLVEIFKDELDTDNLVGINTDTNSVLVTMTFKYRVPMIERSYRLYELNDPGSFMAGSIYMGALSKVKYLAVTKNFLGLASKDIRPSDEEFFIDTDFIEIGSSFTSNN
jgi:hypothetical protein